MEYREQLRRPEWQKKRLKIMERDDFKCTICGNSNSQLHVHHLYYLPKTKVWEYDDDGLKTVCEEHHEQLTKELSKLSGLIAFEILKKRFDIL